MAVYCGTIQWQLQQSKKTATAFVEEMHMLRLMISEKLSKKFKNTGPELKRKYKDKRWDKPIY